MGFTHAVKTCFRKYITFSGRASRPEYWWFVLFLVLGGAVLGTLDVALFGTTLVETGGAPEYRSDGPFVPLFTLGTLLPGFAAGWRRMHDSGRSGLHLFYPLIVLIGIGSFAGLMGGFDNVASGDLGPLLASVSGAVLAVASLIFVLSPLIVVWWLTRPSQPGPNKYGPNPHEVTP